MGESSRPGPTPEVLAHQMAEHEGLVRWVVRQQWRGKLSFEEALHAGRLGLWQALRRYDPNRGTRFSSYAVPAIRHAVWAAVAEVQTTAGWAGEPVSAGERADEAEEVIAQLDRAEVAAVLAEAVSQLAPREQQVVVEHNGLDGWPPRTFAALGRELGVSRQRVHQIHRAALVMLAHPVASLPVRRLVGRHERADYQQTLARQRQRSRQGRDRRWARRVQS
jgi:RNA polymerase sigma factor (sigma-70 family)